jgi:hypothetical protein
MKYVLHLRRFNIAHSQPNAVFKRVTTIIEWKLSAVEFGALAAQLRKSMAKRCRALVTTLEAGVEGLEAAI